MIRSYKADTCFKDNINKSSTALGLDVGFGTNFGGGSTNEGLFVSDVVSVAGVDLRRVTFGLVQRAKNIVQWLDVAGGTLGLGYDRVEGDSGILTKLVQDGLIASRAYSVWLKDIGKSNSLWLSPRQQYLGNVAQIPTLVHSCSVPLMSPSSKRRCEAFRLCELQTVILTKLS